MPRLPAPSDYDGWVELLAVPHVAKQAYWHLVVSPDARDAVRLGLADEDPAVRAWCCKVLDHLADEASFDLLVEMLDDAHPRTRFHAIHALACDRCKADVCTPGKERVLPLAIDLLRNDPDQHVRAVAAEIVGRWAHEDDTASAALVEAKTLDPVPAVRKKAGWYAPGGTIYAKRAAIAGNAARRR